MCRKAALTVFTLPGMYLQQGKELCWLVEKGEKMLHAWVLQEDIGGFRGLEGRTVVVELPLFGQEASPGKITPVAPRPRPHRHNPKGNCHGLSRVLLYWREQVTPQPPVPLSAKAPGRQGP